MGKLTAFIQEEYLQILQLGRYFRSISQFERDRLMVLLRLVHLFDGGDYMMSAGVVMARSSHYLHGSIT